MRRWQNRRREERVDRLRDDVCRDDDVSRHGLLAVVQRRDKVAERAVLRLDHFARVNGNVLLKSLLLTFIIIRAGALV